MSDFTRWNRSGLSRLRYVDGNAATFLDHIRKSLHESFEGRWMDRLEPPYDESENGEDEYWARHRKNEKLEKQYLDRGDLLWELLRTFARSCHVLTEQIDAHANEAFLRTATEWDEVRKHVAMLDYHPVGATSATTFLAIEARSAGTVERGLQVRHRPAAGKPIVFETLEDVAIDPAWNVFEVEGAGQSQALLQDLADEALWRVPPRARLRKGESALILFAGFASAAAAGAQTNGTVGLDYSDETWKTFVAGQTTMLSSPRFRRAPWINGKNVRRSATPHGLAKGSAVAWQDPDGQWRFALVKRADSFGLELELPRYAIPDWNEEFTGNDQWPDWSETDIPLEPATRLIGSLTFPAESATEEELVLGALANFTARHLYTKPPAPVGEYKNPFEEFPSNDILGFENVEVEDLETLKDFIIWLLSAIPGVKFTLSPDILVDLGAMIKTKDARIPSTGQLVFQAFLDLFGGGDATEPTNFDPPPPMHGMFRYWPAPGAPPETTEDREGWRDTGEGAPLGGEGEFWFFPKNMPGSGLPERRLTLINQPDGGWYFFDGRPTGLAIGDWAAARFSDKEGWVPVKILDIQIDLPGLTTPMQPYERHDRASAFAVQLELADGIVSSDIELLELQGDYRAEEPPIGAEVNEAAVSGPIRLIPPCPKENLKSRRLLAVTKDGTHSQLVEVDAVDEHACTITLADTLSSDHFTAGNLRLYGNVVRAGHGERRPDLRLSSGTATDRGPTLNLRQTLVSTVPDSRLAHGAREDLEVVIDGARWRHVLRLDDSAPSDRHFTVSTTEEGYLQLRFGDGRRGRRLPVGTGNVLVRYYRVGAGRIGPLPPGSLEDLVHPHPLVLSVRQPSATTAGSDMERPEHMRELAPAALLSLDRAVSPTDFAHVATQHSSVLQARAEYRVDSRILHDVVEVRVVPAGGDELDSAIRDEIVDYLQRRAIPEVLVTVGAANPIRVVLDVDIRIDIEVYTGEEVVATVVRELTARLSRERRAIGADLHLSEIYGVVEAVTGVEDSVCSVREYSCGRVHAAPNDIVFVANAEAVHCVFGEYTP